MEHLEHCKRRLSQFEIAIKTMEEESRRQLEQLRLQAQRKVEQRRLEARRFTCDCCHKKHEKDRELFRHKACKHRLCRTATHNHLKRSIDARKIPLTCSIEGCQAEITFQEASLALSAEEFESLELLYAQMLESSFYFECVVCGDDRVPMEDLFEPPTCGHKTCRNCAKRHIKGQYEAGRFPLTCVSCADEMPFYLAETVLTEEEMAKMHSAGFSRAVAGATYCPQVDCKGLAIIEEPNTQFICPICHYQMCVKCEQVWHPKQTCEEAATERDRQVKEKQAEEAFEAMNVAKCPRCRVPVERNGGCNFVQCRCGEGFCVLCQRLIPAAGHGGAAWTAGGHTCPLWPAN